MQTIHDGVLVNGEPLVFEEDEDECGCSCRRCVLHDDCGGCITGHGEEER